MLDFWLTTFSFWFVNAAHIGTFSFNVISNWRGALASENQCRREWRPLPFSSHVVDAESVKSNALLLVGVIWPVELRTKTHYFREKPAADPGLLWIVAIKNDVSADNLQMYKLFWSFHLDSVSCSLHVVLNSFSHIWIFLWENLITSTKEFWFSIHQR